MTELRAAAMRGPAPRRAASDGHGRSGLIDRGELVHALDQAAERQVTIISAPAGSGKTSLLHAWADRPDQPRRVAFMSVRPGQQDSQLFWLMLLGTVRSAAGAAGAPEPPPAAPGFNGPAMVAATTCVRPRAGLDRAAGRRGGDRGCRGGPPGKAGLAGVSEAYCQEESGASRRQANRV